MFGNRIKELRKKHKWTQQKLAEKAQLSYGVITRMEQGLAQEPTIQTAIKIADAFSITLDDLVGRKVSKK